METLVPDVEATVQDIFRITPGYLEFGKLYFDEVIGTEQNVRVIIITDPLVNLPNGFSEGKCVVEKSVAFETVGDYKEVRVITITDSHVKCAQGYSGGKCITETSENLKRRTLVRLFPNEEIAKMGIHLISLDGLEKYKR
jgi:hypothetical protein